MRTVIYNSPEGPKEYVVLSENPASKDAAGKDVPVTLDLGTVEANHDKALAEGAIREGKVHDPKGNVIPANTVLVDGKRTTLVIGKCPVSTDGRVGTCTDPDAKIDPNAPIAPVAPLVSGQHWAKTAQGRTDADTAARAAAEHDADAVAAGVAHRATLAKTAPQTRAEIAQDKKDAAAEQRKH